MEKLSRYGFSKYSDTSLYRTGNIAKVHIDLYSNGVYNLYSRIVGQDIKYLKEEGRLILFNKNDEIIMDIIVNNITNPMMKSYGDTCSEIVFSINYMKYRMFLCQHQTKEIMFAG